MPETFLIFFFFHSYRSFPIQGRVKSSLETEQAVQRERVHSQFYIFFYFFTKKYLRTLCSFSQVKEVIFHHCPPPLQSQHRSLFLPLGWKRAWRPSGHPDFATVDQGGQKWKITDYLHLICTPLDSTRSSPSFFFTLSMLVKSCSTCLLALH